MCIYERAEISQKNAYKEVKHIIKIKRKIKKQGKAILEMLQRKHSRNNRFPALFPYFNLKIATLERSPSLRVYT